MSPSRHISRIYIGTQEQFAQMAGTSYTHELVGAKVYISDGGAVYVVADQMWVDFVLHDKGKVLDA